MSSASKRLAKAARELAKETGDILREKKLTADSLHDVRVVLKRIRTLTRIFAHDASDTPFLKVQNGLRGIARRLSTPRDRDVLKDLLARYVRKAGGTVPIRQKRCSVPLKRDLAVAERRILKACELVERGAGRLEISDIVEAEACRLRRRVRKRGRDAGITFAESAFHDWRKSVKNFYYLLDFGLVDGHPPRAFKAALRGLGKRLGHLHDLHNLSARLASGTAGLDRTIALKLLAAVHRDADKQAALCLKSGRRMTREWL